MFGLAALPLLYVIFVSLGLTVRQRWMAILLYVSCKWIAEDYSPAGIGTLLSLGVLALACRWLLPRHASTSSQARSTPGFLDIASTAWYSRVEPRNFRGLCCTHPDLLRSHVHHELSPYIVVIQLGALAVAGLIRATLVPTRYLATLPSDTLPHLSFVDAESGLLDSVGAFFSKCGTSVSKMGALVRDKCRTSDRAFGGALLLGLYLGTCTARHVGSEDGRASRCLRLRFSAVLSCSRPIIGGLRESGDHERCSSLSRISRERRSRFECACSEGESAARVLALSGAPRGLPRDFQVATHARRRSEQCQCRTLRVQASAGAGNGWIGVSRSWSPAEALFFPAFIRQTTPCT